MFKCKGHNCCIFKIDKIEPKIEKEINNVFPNINFLVFSFVILMKNKTVDFIGWWDKSKEKRRIYISHLRCSFFLKTCEDRGQER